MTDDPVHKLANDVHGLMLRLILLEAKEAKREEAIEELTLRIVALETRGKETDGR